MLPCLAVNCLIRYPASVGFRACKSTLDLGNAGSVFLTMPKRETFRLFNPATFAGHRTLSNPLTTMRNAA